MLDPILNRAFSCGKPLWDVNRLMLLLVGLVNGVQITATGRPAQDFVGHLVFDDG